MIFKNFIQNLTETSAVNQLIKGDDKKYDFIDDNKIRELQSCYLKMLNDFNRTCNKYKLHYTLIGGTLLGKIRHNGFIPWDDDFDIAMPRKDYEKLKKIFSESELNKNYILKGPGCQDGAEVRITKIYKKDSSWIPLFYKKNAMNKIFIDIFVIDYVPINPIIKFFKGIWCDFLIIILGCLEFKINGQNKKLLYQGIKGNINYIVRTILGTIFSILSLEEWYNKFDKSSYYKHKSKLSTIANGKLFYFGEIIASDVFYPFKKSDFCGITVWIPNKPEIYLEHRYGNYKKIPDSNEREIHYVKKLEIGKII